MRTCAILAKGAVNASAKGGHDSWGRAALKPLSGRKSTGRGGVTYSNFDRLSRAAGLGDRRVRQPIAPNEEDRRKNAIGGTKSTWFW